MPMKTIEGYSKEKYTDTSVLLAGGGTKPLSDFIGTLTWDSTNKKITYTPIGGNATDLVSFGSNAFNSTSFLPLTGGEMSNTNKVTNLNADLLDGFEASEICGDAANLMVGSYQYTKDNPCIISGTGGDFYYYYSDIYFYAVEGETYIISCETDGTWHSHTGYGTPADKFCSFWLYNGTTHVSFGASMPAVWTASASGKWWIRINIYSNGSDTTTVKFWNIKAEKGKIKPTGWMINCEDPWGSALKLYTGRTLTIGSSGQTFDGTQNVSWSLNDIGVNTTNFPGLNKTGTVTSITVQGSDGISGSGTITTAGTVTLTNSGVRSTTIHGNYLRVNTNGSTDDLTIPYATNSDYTYLLKARSSIENISGIQFITGQIKTGTADGNAYSGSSTNAALLCFPPNATAINSSGTANETANVSILRIIWGTQHWHDFHFSPNYTQVFHRASLGSSAGSWKFIPMRTWDGTNFQLGSSSKPVYINSSGNFAECNDYPTIPSTYDWTNITDKPSTATRWPAWSEVTSKPTSKTIWGQTYLDASSNFNNVDGWLTINSPDWDNDCGISINEGGSASYGFDILYGAGDLFKIATRSGSTTRTNVLTISRGSTNVSIAGNLTASSIIKSGGTSSQFLKADGSIDDNTYATTSNLSNYLPLSGGTMNNGKAIEFGSGSGGSIVNGTTDNGTAYDGASYDNCNLLIKSWYGIGLYNTCAGGDRIDGISWYINVRYGDTYQKGSATATKFIGPLQGNADTATDADTVDGYHHTRLFKLYSRADVGDSPNFDNLLDSNGDVLNGMFEHRITSETSGESGSKPFNGYGPFISLKYQYAFFQLAGSNGAGWYIRGTQSAAPSGTNLAWQTLITSANIGSQTVGSASYADSAGSANKVAYSLSWTNSSGTAQSFDGSSAVTINGIYTAYNATNATYATYVQTKKSTSGAWRYLTFVDSNNDSATSETVYTNKYLQYYPSVGELKCNKVTLQNDGTTSGGLYINIDGGNNNPINVYTSATAFAINAENTNTHSNTFTASCAVIGAYGNGYHYDFLAPWYTSKFGGLELGMETSPGASDSTDKSYSQKSSIYYVGSSKTVYLPTTYARNGRVIFVINDGNNTVTFQATGKTIKYFRRSGSGSGSGSYSGEGFQCIYICIYYANTWYVAPTDMTN